MITGHGRVYWLTGLSGAGKSTLCRRLAASLRQRGRPVLLLDGDELREILGATAAHGRDQRLQLAMRYAHLCHMISAQGVDVAIATISLFREVHDWNRGNLPGYVEVFIDVPMSELARRDSKGLYARAARGEAGDVAGVGFEVDFPVASDLRVEWRPGRDADAMFDELLQQLTKKGMA